MQVTDEMVSRFLCWPLPKDFGPDCGISFDGRKDDEWNKNKTWPIGTNLLTASQARQMLEHVLQASPASATLKESEASLTWRCFHCDEVFTKVADAAFHFGYADLEKPACLVDAVELRNLQLELRRYREEDTDLHRALHAKDSEMQQAVMRAEEQGYARGLADAKKNPEELGLVASPETALKAAPVAWLWPLPEPEPGREPLTVVSESAGRGLTKAFPVYASPLSAPAGWTDNLRGLDTNERVRFYEHDFYVLSNFSAFRITFDGNVFDTSEAAYHYQRFTDATDGRAILYANSAHEAFRYAQENKSRQRWGWDEMKVGIMLKILRAKAEQHEYVRRKLLATGDRELVEDSWRDDFWGWGPNRDGKNMLGKLWMGVRAELRAASPEAPQP